MNPARFLFVLALSTALAGASSAADTGNFVMRLGVDTTSVEHYTRTPSRIEIDQVGRSPRVLRRHYVIERDAQGNFTHLTGLVTNPSAPAGAPAFQQIDAHFTGDSAMIDIKRDTVVQHVHAPVPAHALVMAGGNPWSVLEVETMKFVAQKADSIHDPLYNLGAGFTGWVSVHRLGRDSLEVDTDNNVYHVRVDRRGLVQGVLPVRGTGKFSAERVASIDLAGATAAFQAGEKQAGAMGALSTRDTVRAGVGGANVWIDYGRPAKRGRVIYGGIVPWNDIWRTGANAATQFKTDKALVMGGVTVPAGFYTLWTVPAPDGWKLIVNSETGEWGTEHKPDKDLYTIPLGISTLPQVVERFTIGVDPAGNGGTLRLDWDTTRASVAFTVQP